MKKVFFFCFFASLVLLACGGDTSRATAPDEPSLKEISFVGWESLSQDDSSQALIIAPDSGYGDSLVVDYVGLSEGMSLYLAADDDPEDPELGEKVEETSVIPIAGTDSFRLVVLDSRRRIDAIWTISMVRPSVSSSSGIHSSSSAAVSCATQSSSSSLISVSSSSSAALVPSSSSTDSIASSSSLPSSSSSGSSSSSTAPLSSSAQVLSAEKEVLSFRVDSIEATIDTVEKTIYVELPYGSDFSSIAATVSVSPGAESGFSSPQDLRSGYEFSVTAEDGSSSIWTVKAGCQLPGSDFSSWADGMVAPSSFWGTSSDAMATSVSKVVYSYSSEANLTESDGAARLETKAIEASTGLITWKEKIATGILFSGSFEEGVTTEDLYKDATDFTQAADLLDYMTLGQPFTARPVSFTVTYSYDPVTKTGVEQRGLIYVLLVNAETKTIVASGAILPAESASGRTETVSLQYGGASFVTSDLPVPTDLQEGTGEEEVTSIYVLFASSAGAHVIGLSGGSGEDVAAKGTAGSSLTVDDLNLHYF